MFLLGYNIVQKNYPQEKLSRNIPIASWYYILFNEYVIFCEKNRNRSWERDSLLSCWYAAHWSVNECSLFCNCTLLHLNWPNVLLHMAVDSSQSLRQTKNNLFVYGLNKKSGILDKSLCCTQAGQMCFCNSLNLNLDPSQTFKTNEK